MASDKRCEHPPEVCVLFVGTEPCALCAERATRPPPGALVTCELCPTPHPIDDDGVRCRYPKPVSKEPDHD